MKVSPRPAAPPPPPVWRRLPRAGLLWAAVFTALAILLTRHAFATGPRDAVAWALLAGYAIAQAQDALRDLRRSLG